MLNHEQLNALHRQLGADNILTDAADCWPYGYDNSRHHSPPEAVVFAKTHAQVLELVRFCNNHLIPLTARGRGTGTTGGTVPVKGGIVLSFERMDRILEVDAPNRNMIVQPGATNQAVQEAAGKYGFFWAPDPTSAAYCTVGGNLAFNSAGPRAVKYGTARENTLALKAVTGTGEEIKTGVLTTKGVVGLDLTRLLIGSEGTLAVITEATLRLIPISETKRTLRAIYDSVDAAARAVSSLMSQPVIPCALELMDGHAINMIRSLPWANLPEDASALLMIEVDGSEDCIESAAIALSQSANIKGCLEVAVAGNAEEVRNLWSIRKALSPTLRKVAPHKINEDVVVPVSRMAELINGLNTLSQQHNISIVNFGHAGNGNIHVNLLVDPANNQQMEAAKHCLDDVFSLVLKLGGTLSGEHGVGITKRDFVDREIDPVTLELMQRIKLLFDPNEILNPGKTLPPRQEISAR